MSGTSRTFCGALLVAFVTFFAGSAAIAQDAASIDKAWRVDKSSGEVWLSSPDVQPAALTSDTMLKPGDTIRTGANGRVLLMRGAESILVSANSVVGIPTDKQKQDGLPTTILQQVGTILLDVEKRNVQHFEVATPYLAAVVKGTQFRVTVDDKTSRVEVLRGQVQVTDYKSGQRALVNKDQAAAVTFQGAAGLSLSGSGPLNPIELGVPRTPLITPFTIAAVSPAAASSRAQEAQPQVAAPMRPVEWKSSDRSSNDYSWSSMMSWSKDVLGFGNKSKNEDNTTIIAIPVLIGLSATIGAIALRRKKKPTDKLDRR